MSAKMADDLLELAAELSKRGTRRSKQVSLRRSASTAYYAVFHELCRLCADGLVGVSQPWQIYTPIYRSVDHATARRVFDNDPKGLVLGAKVTVIGRLLISLQRQRSLADYDPRPFPLGREQVLDLVDEARRAVELLRALPRAEALLLAVHLVARTR